jgi:GMP synthase (glutamine-hydrolysing)
MILIVDNGSKFIGYLEEELKLRNIKFKIIHPADEVDFSKLREIKGVILSGGPKGPREMNLVNDYAALINFKVPILGVCLGHEVIAAAFGSRIGKLSRRQAKVEDVIIIKMDPIFRSLKEKVFLREAHNNYVRELPKDFNLLAYSKVCKVEVMKHKRKKIYSFQGHPEVSGKDGSIILRNFMKMCGIDYQIMV